MLFDDNPKSISEKGWIQASFFHCASDSSRIVLVVVVDDDGVFHDPVGDDRTKIRSSYANGSFEVDSVVDVIVAKFKTQYF